MASVAIFQDQIKLDVKFHAYISASQKAVHSELSRVQDNTG